MGKAGPGSKGNRGLRRQIQEFLDFGNGKPPGHWDGRLIWQLAEAGSLVIAWKELPAERLNPAEAGYHAAFVRSTAGCRSPTWSRPGSQGLPAYQPAEAAGG